jgi:hypothetical protein
MAVPFPIKMSFKPLGRAIRSVRSNLPEPNFLTLHYLYFVVICLISAVIFWSAATPFRSVRFVDSIFLCVSAMTMAGLNTINLSTLNTFQQALLFILIVIGSTIFVSAFVVHVRRKAFDNRFRTELEREARYRGRSPWFPMSRSLSRRSASRLGEGVSPKTVEPEPRFDGQVEEHRHNPRPRGQSNEPEKDTRDTSEGIENDFDHRSSEGTLRYPISFFGSPNGAQQDHITFSNDTRSRDSVHPTGGLVQRVFSMSGVGARSDVQTGRFTVQTPTRPPSEPLRTLSDGTRDEVVSSGFVARNSNFHHLTEADRFRLGGTEYQAVTMLAWIVPAYFVAWQVLGGITLGAYVNKYYASTARENGLNPWYGSCLLS